MLLQLGKMLKEAKLSLDEVDFDTWPIQPGAPGEIPTDRKWIAGFMYWRGTASVLFRQIHEISSIHPGLDSYLRISFMMIELLFGAQSL